MRYDFACPITLMPCEVSSADDLPILDAFHEMATTLGVSKDMLAWRAIEEFVAPECPGFLLIHKIDAAGKVNGIEIREFIIRKDHTFYRYKKGDAKCRNRAMENAKAMADYETATFGLGKTTFTELSVGVQKDVLEAPAPPLPTKCDPIRKKYEKLFNNIEHPKGLDSGDIMSQDEIEILLEGFLLGQRMQCQAGMK